MMTRRTFTRKFQRATGMSLSQWLTRERLFQAQELLESSGLAIEIVAERVGFTSVHVFREQFKKRFDMSPMAWKKNRSSGETNA